MWLPRAERRDEIRFYFAKRLPYNVRLVASFALLLVGVAIQIAVPEWFAAGLPFILLGVLLVLTRGYDNVERPARGQATWRPTDITHVEQILELNRKSREWDQDLVDVTCTRGVVSLVAVLGAVAAATWFLGRYDRSLMIIVGADAAVVILPFWLTGVRFILKNDDLIVKAAILGDLWDWYAPRGREGEEFQFQLESVAVRKKDGSGEMPRDIKALVQFRERAEDFLGLQMQISINRVQGTSYPYFYCVLVARKGFGGFDRARIEPPWHKITLEFESEADVDVAVVRQTTTKTSGYHTTTKDTQRIFAYALEQARALLAPG